MKVVYENGEKDRLKRGYELKKEYDSVRLFDEDNPERIYGLTFKVTKPEIAEYILLSLSNDRLEDFDIGINVQSIEFDVLPKRSEIKDKLLEVIDNVLG